MYTLILTITKNSYSAPDTILAVPGFPSRNAAETAGDQWVRENGTTYNNVSAIVAATTG